MNLQHSESGQINGGRFDFEDGGTFCGGWEDSKAHGHGVCTGPKNQGAYSGAWHYGFEVSGVYTWPSGSSFEGQWQNGKRHGLGIETRGRWIYRGEWTQGFKGRYGVRQSTTSTARYEGTWANGLQDGYGSETYADGGTYQGQWLRGMRHGYGVRQSAPFGLAARFRPKSIRASMTSLRSNEEGSNQTINTDPSEKRNHRIDDARGGFVLKAKSDDKPVRRNSLVEKTKKGFLGLKIRKQKSTSDLEKKGSGSMRSTASSASWISTDSSRSGMTNKSVHTDSNASFVVEDELLDGSITETYMGEWKNDKRCGYGISERSDGLKYEGEWFTNKKYGYGVTTFRDGTKEEGKYKNNVLITSQKKKHIFLIRSAKFRERIDAAVDSSQRASKYALQKADIAISRTATARGKAELADIAGDHAKDDSDVAITTAKEFAPDFKPSLLERFEKLRVRDKFKLTNNIKHELQQKPLCNLGSNELLEQQHNFQYQDNRIPPRILNQSLSNYVGNSIDSNTQVEHIISESESVYGSPLKQPKSNPQQQYSSSNYNTQANQQYQYPANIQKANFNSLSQHTIAQEINHVSQDIQSDSYRRNSKQFISSSNKPPLLGAVTHSSSIDYFDHYKRPPSRDSSVDRYTRAASRLGGSRQPSVDRNNAPNMELDKTARSASLIRNSLNTSNGLMQPSSRAETPSYHPFDQNQTGTTIPNQPFEEVLLRQRTLGQDIIPSQAIPKRTESLCMGNNKPLTNNVNKIVTGCGGGGGGGTSGGGALGFIRTKTSGGAVNTSLQRKKSLPDVQQLPFTIGSMSREEVSALGSARREEIRRQINESERLRANPLLYLVSPQVKDWFSRQQLVMLVLVINIALAIVFFKMLT